MDEFIQILLKESLGPSSLILWLNGEKSIEALEKQDTLKYNFVPLFLNYLRDQTTSYLQYSSHTGLTPNKTSVFTKYASPLKLNRKSSKSTKAKTLDFSRTPNNYNGKKLQKNMSPDANQSDSIIELNDTYHTPHKSPNYGIPLSPVNSPEWSSNMYNTSTPRHNNSQSDFNHLRHSRKLSLDDDVKASKKKSSLADYIPSALSETKSSKKKSMKETLRESNIVSSSSILNECNKVNFNINDADAFPPMKSEPNFKDKPKRIKPTTLVKVSPDVTNDKSSLQFGSPFSRKQNDAFLLAEESNCKSTDRQNLRESIDLMQKSVSGPSTSMRSPAISLVTKVIGIKDFHPTLSEVTHKHEIDLLSQIYSDLILYSKVPNIMIEMFFILQLLTVDTSFSEESFLSDSQSSSNYLNSFPNCIYFSIKTLGSICDCLISFDHSLVKALSENQRIYNFDPGLNNRLVTLSASLTSVKSHTRNIKSPILSVSFQCDTDNRNNFPNTNAFTDFKKQRDDFYEILNIWESHHMEPNWSFDIFLGNRVRQLFARRQDPVNVAHFARLFQSQLCKDGDNDISCYKSGDDFLTELEKQNPERLSKLSGRIVTPRGGGPVPHPSFPGSQEFFKDFILSAQNHAFNIYLRDTLLARILQINDFLVNLEEEEPNEEQLREKVWSNLQVLRLLGKFLGFIEFLPYRSVEYLPDDAIVSQAVLRNNCHPPVCFSSKLREGVSEHSAIIVVSWLVEFLSWADQAAFHTRYYSTLILELIYLYKLLYVFRKIPDGVLCFDCKSGSSINSMNSLYLKLILGWLFSLPQVPDRLFYAVEDQVEIDHNEYKRTTKAIQTHYTHYCSECLKSLIVLSKIGSHQDSFSKLNQDLNNLVIEDIPVEERNIDLTPHKKRNFWTTPQKKKKRGKKHKDECYSPLKTPSKFLKVSMLDTPENTPDKTELDKRVKKFYLDSWAFIDYQIILSCCPFITELKGLLSDFVHGNSRNNAGGSARKITPLSVSDKKSQQAPIKALQLQLEDNFFHNQPTSLRKTIDFMVERIHSNVVRKIRFTIIPQLKDDCLDRLKSCVTTGLLSSPARDRINEGMEKKIQNLSHELSLEVREKAMFNMKQLIEEKNINICLRFLLPDEVSQKSLDISLGIVNRLVKEKLFGWMTTFLHSNFCTQELTTEAKKFLKNSQKLANETGLSDTSATSISFMSDSHVSATGNSTAVDPEEQLDSSASGNLGPRLKLSSSKAESELKLDSVPKFDKEHDESARSPSLLLCEVRVDLRRMIWCCEKRAPRPDIDICKTLNNVYATVRGRRDMTIQVYLALEQLVADLVANLCICQPILITKEVVQKFSSFWSPLEDGGIFKTTSNLIVFLIPRTIKLLSIKSKEEQKLSWQKIELILIELVFNKQFLTTTKLQELVVALLQHSWPQDTRDGIKNLCDRLTNNRPNGEYSDADQMIDWVGWVFSQMEDYDE